MSYSQLLLLAAVAGFTVYLGLPVAALRRLKLSTKGALSGIATGILVFLTVEILGHVFEFGEKSLEQGVPGANDWWSIYALFALMAAGLTLGLIGIPLLESWLLRRWTHRASTALGFVAQSTMTQPKERTDAELKPYALAMMISAGIGLHNFSEGLAIGQVAAGGAVSFALVLIIGFALHNITEGFGIAAPLAGARPSFGFLFLAGLVAGGPTFLGTLVGASWSSEWASIAFLSLAGGALLYVIAELLRLGHAMLAKVPFMLSISFGILIGYLTELIVELSLGS